MSHSVERADTPAGWRVRIAKPRSILPCCHEQSKFMGDASLPGVVATYTCRSTFKATSLVGCDMPSAPKAVAERLAALHSHALESCPINFDSPNAL